MDSNTKEIWYTEVYRSYIANWDGESGLLLDDFKVQRNSKILEVTDLDNANRYFITPNYTALLQPCDVGLNKSLNHGRCLKTVVFKSRLIRKCDSSKKGRVFH